MPQPLQYEVPAVLARQAPPAWVWTVIGIYGVLLAGFLTAPVWAHLLVDEWGFTVAVAILVSVLVLCGWALLITPVRLARQRPLSRKSYLLPLIASGVLFALLLWAGGIALLELLEWDSEDLASWLLLGGAAGVWAIWSAVLWLATRNRDPMSFATRFHRWLIGGSVVELLVAVPCHIVCRRRAECCAGYLTGTAICLGALVLFVAFGPSILLLYLKRARQISGTDGSPVVAVVRDNP